MPIQTFNTNSYCMAADITDALVLIGNEELPGVILQLLVKTTSGEEVMKFAYELEQMIAEGFDAEYDLLYQYWHGQRPIGLMKFLTMSVENSEIEELRRFHLGQVSNELERRKALSADREVRMERDERMERLEHDEPTRREEAPPSGGKPPSLFDLM